ncbi:hypothetical protein [Flavobacterium limnophilum]|uniref:hypothetical protein n=1 Tax=Flavobacterium limnophilum TaxID=3003262 RepID=UPI002482E219|nr:hypothetical protein [Flavobacterium limnophilum]
MKIKLCLFFILAANIVLAQESGGTALNGKINANTIDLEGIYVINLKTEKSTITEKDGYFSIAAIPGDTLLFSAIHLKEIRVVLEKKDFQTEFLVKMESRITSLKEVVVKRYDNINAVDMGISPSGMKHRTPEERKLYTATSTAGDALLNFMSGRTAMLKKEIVVEGKLSFIDQIDNMFNEDYFRKTLKIPSEYVKGFKYYIVDNERFTSILKSKNKTQIEFGMVSLAEKYNLIISDEK